MEAERSLVGWAVVGAILLGTVVAAILHIQPNRSLIEQFAAESRELEHFEQLRLALSTAAEAEKSAVLAITDEESRAFADAARAAASAAEQHRATLERLLAERGTAEERQRMAAFSTAFAELNRVDANVLDLAVRNSNIKATALAFGPFADAIGAIDAALSRLVAAQARSGAASAKKVILLAAGAQAAVLRIQGLVPPHIAEQDDAKMDALEARMRDREGELGRDLQALTGLVASDDADLAAAKAGCARMLELERKILELSRENTNVRSLSLSLNEKRKASLACQAALGALGAAIEAAKVSGRGPRSR